MLGYRVKELREARAWTQEHLAEAAGVSLRTIQRLERGARYASETALAVASALEIDVRELLECSRRPAADTLWKPLPALPVTIVALLLALPGLVYVALGLLQLGAGIAMPRLAAFDSPLLLVGGPLLALLLLMLSAVEPRGEWRDGRLTLSGVALRPSAAPVWLSLGTLAIFGMLALFLSGHMVGRLARVIGL